MNKLIRYPRHKLYYLIIISIMYIINVNYLHYKIFNRIISNTSGKLDWNRKVCLVVRAYKDDQ